MFVYVFSEADRDLLLRDGFELFCEDASAKAWVFLKDSGPADTLDRIEKVITSRLAFHGGTEKDYERGCIE